MPSTCLALAAGLLSTINPASAAVLDCPLRDSPFSVNSPLIDILLSPAAIAVIERFQPGMVSKLPPNMRSTRAPTFGAILAARTAISIVSGARDEAKIAQIDAALRSVSVTAADRAARCERYDNERPQFSLPARKGKIKPRLLLFEKVNGFRHASMPAANALFRELARRNGWQLVSTRKAGIMNPGDLRKFDAVIWNNVSGDVLTLSQRNAFENYIRGGGGYFGIHGSAGDVFYSWDWYPDTLVGARFIGHPDSPQLQDGAVRMEANPAGIGALLPPGWTMNEEWYSFRQTPRPTSQVVASLDESTYRPVGPRGQDLRMGDHPIAWTRCVGKGRSFYSAVGHRPESYSDPRHQQLIEDAIRWTAGKGRSTCPVGSRVPSN